MLKIRAVGLTGNTKQVLPLLPSQSLRSHVVPAKFTAYVVLPGPDRVHQGVDRLNQQELPVASAVRTFTTPLIPTFLGHDLNSNGPRCDAEQRLATTQP